MTQKIFNIRAEDGFVIKDSGKRVKFDSGFNRDTGENKPRYDLIPHELLTRLAIHYTNGAKKYDENNWRKANSEIEYNRFIASAWRHFIAFIRGDKDEDHGIACIWNIMAYIWHKEYKNEK